MAKRPSRELPWAALLILLVIVAYVPVWWAGTIWDDEGVVFRNPVVAGPLGLKEIWTTSAADICPFTLTMLRLEYALWGNAMLPYHLVNVLLQGLSAIVLWRVLLGLRVPGAWLGAALWAVHPVNVESVAWIVEQKNTLSGFFYLLAILFFIRSLRSAAMGAYGLTLLFSFLAITSKTSTVILPVVLCLFAWWIEGRWHWRTVIKTAPIFLLSLVAGTISIWTQHARGSDDPLWARSWPERLVTAGDAIWFYLAKLIVPHPLAIVYPRWEISAGSVLSFVPFLAACVLMIILWLKRETWGRSYFFTLTYFVVALLPELGLLNDTYSVYSFVADHFQYLASMGPLALLGAGIVGLADRFARERWLQPALGAGLILILAGLSWQRAWIYRNEETLWIDTLAKNPKCWVGHINLGLALVPMGQLDEASTQYQTALDLNPHAADAHNDLALVLVRQDRMGDAESHYRQATQLDPAYVAPHNNLGNLFVREKRMPEAVAEYEQALAINPDDPDAHTNLGNVLLQAGKVDEAIPHYQRALEFNPTSAETHNNFGMALIAKRQLREAADQFREALRLNPDYEVAQANLNSVQNMDKSTTVPGH